MPNGNVPTGIPGPLQHLQDVAATFEKFDDIWSHLRYQELGGDAFHLSGLPEGLISATTTLYAAGRDLAGHLAVDLGTVTNPARFPDVSHFIRYFEERIAPRTTELEAVAADCENELAAIPADLDFDALFAQQQARVGMRALSPWHLKTTVKEMVRLFRTQLRLLGTASADVAVLKRAHGARQVERVEVPVEEAPRPQNAFYQEGAIWRIAYKGTIVPPIEDAFGLHDYAYLLARPGQVVSALDLMRATARHDPDVRRPRSSDRTEREPVGMDDAFNKVLENDDITALKEQMTELKKDLARAEEDNDEARIERLRRDLEDVRTYLLSNMQDKFPDDRKKAQSAVYRRMMKARARIADYLPELAQYLEDRVSTGFTCVYAADPAIRWDLTPPDRTSSAAHR